MTYGKPRPRRWEHGTREGPWESHCAVPASLEVALVPGKGVLCLIRGCDGEQEARTGSGPCSAAGASAGRPSLCRGREGPRAALVVTAHLLVDSRQHI